MFQGLSMLTKNSTFQEEEEEEEEDVAFQQLRLGSLFHTKTMSF